MKSLFLLCLLPFLLLAERVETFYGPFNIEEPVLLELMAHPAFQRLKEIHQYGVSYYTTHSEEYNRYDHSLGVFALLRYHDSPLKEQIAGLLHDVSHTVFSHVGDWIFGKEHQEIDYQSTIHTNFLEKSGLGSILRKYHFDPQELIPAESSFPMLEQPGPKLCADRIDYNIQGAFYQGFITYEEAVTLFKEIHFKDGLWVAENIELMQKLVRFSLYMTETCWGSADNHFLSRTLADAILRALDIQLISLDNIHFGTDDLLWNKLLDCPDLVIQAKMRALFHPEQHYTLVDYKDADYVVKSKFRGIDPWVMYEGSMTRLMTIDPSLRDEFLQTKERMTKGWPLQFVSIQEHPVCRE